MADVELIWNSPDEELVSRSQREPGGWLHSPAQLELFRAAENRLIAIARQRGQDVARLKRVRAARPANTTLVYIFPVADDDPMGIETKQNHSHIFINLRSLLQKGNYLVEPGYRERYNLDIAGPDSPVGPALVFDLNRLLERRQESAKGQSKDKEKGKEMGKEKAAEPAPSTSREE